MKLDYYIIGAIKRGMADLLDRDIEVDWDGEYFGKYEAKVNWCALGSVSSKEAEAFAKKMVLAVELAEILNKYEIYETCSAADGKRCNITNEELLDIRNKIKRYGSWSFDIIMDWVVKRYGKEA
jgi:hypothetical protein